MGKVHQPERLKQLLWVVVVVFFVGACTTEGSGGSAPRVAVTDETPADSLTTTSTAPPSDTSSASRVNVVAVLDGDTFRVLIGGVEEPVRLIGINAPEGGECFATQATTRLSELLADGEVTLSQDESDRDQYGRLLRYVYVDGTLINEILVREGLVIARRYEPDTRFAEVLEQAQDSAERDGVGLWAVDACGTPSGLVIRITDVRFDAPGDDSVNLNGEWVDIQNVAQGPADLSGWVLKDDSASHRYTLPDGFELLAGATVRIFTGCGDDTAAELFWCEIGSAVWNNSGDTAFLVDPLGNIVDTWSY